VTVDGGRIDDDSFLVLFNATPEAVRVVLPPPRFGLHWALEVSTADPDACGTCHDARSELPLVAWSMMVLRRVPSS
jgi:pullulanase/glycogen debranching enzyme